MKNYRRFQVITLEAVKRLRVSGGRRFQHGYEVIDSLEELEPAFGHLIGDHGVIHVHLIDKTLIYEVVKVFLNLAVAHIGGIHYFRLAGSSFPHPEHISDYFDIRAPPADTYLTGRAGLDARFILGIKSYVHTGLLYCPMPMLSINPG
jgi:hypothetical protein